MENLNLVYSGMRGMKLEEAGVILEKQTILPNKFFHISINDLGAEVALRPGDIDPSVDYASFRGVSFSPSISQCVKAIPARGDEDMVYYVYTPIANCVGYLPITEDSPISGEVRIPGEITVNLVGKILIYWKKRGKGRGITELLWKTI